MAVRNGSQNRGWTWVSTAFCAASSASLAYFGREPRHLSLSEAALLVALPQSPEKRRPDRHPERARKARDRVLMRALRAGVIKQAEARLAMKEPAPHGRKPFPKHAPHIARALIAANPQERLFRLTIDRDLQGALQQIARRNAARLGPKHSMAIMAIDNASGEVLAHIGSPDFLDDAHNGPIDMTRAIRSPGAALKPFIYGLAFEDGVARPRTIIDDAPTRFGDYAPQNFDKKWRGEVSVARALQLSLNIPAVKLLQRVGPARFIARLRQCGVNPELLAGARPNLSMALGGLGMNMRNLARAYLALARGGVTTRLRWRASGGGKSEEHGKGGKVKNGEKGKDSENCRLLSPTSAWMIAHILEGSPPPPNALAGRIAYKTGTSYGYRDAWAAGFDGRTTILVWAGRPDGAASPGLFGRSAAAPALFEAFAALGRPPAPLPPPPPGLRLARSNAELPPPLRHFERPETPPDEEASLYPPVKIAFPPDGSRLPLGHENGEGKQFFDPLAIKAEGGKLPLTWMINGAPLKGARPRRRLFWLPHEKGFVRLGVLDALGRSDSVLVRIE
jgi:penicillin-binding protein 1C